MPDTTREICICFQESIKMDCMLLKRRLADTNQYYIWVYKLLDYMASEKFAIHDHSNSLEQVIELEKLIEDKLVKPNIVSVISSIRDYKLDYANFVHGNNKNDHLINFVNEIVDDDKQYPFLQFFNLTNIHSINIIDHFYNKLQLQTNYTNNYPLTFIILEHFSEYQNIQYLYPIVKCINYVMQKFDHRIKRIDASEKTIEDYLKSDRNFQSIYDEFLAAYYTTTLMKVRSQHPQQKLNFKKSSISMFLLNKSNDDKSMIIVDCLQTLANLQNNILNHFHSNGTSLTDKSEIYNHRYIPVQTIKQKQLFDFDEKKLREVLVNKSLIINYEYGKSEEIIYNYEEIESILRNYISCLPLIDMKHIRYFNYQYELYDENVSLIKEIRDRIEQELFENSKRKDIKEHIKILTEDTIINISKSLEYILSYLRTTNIKNAIKLNNKYITETLTIQGFIGNYIQSTIGLDTELDREPFSSIELKYIIDLYELFEEYIFHKILRNYMKSDLRVVPFSNSENVTIINEFMEIIFKNDNIAVCFKDLNCWIGMFKRLLVRSLSPKININFESPLYIYVKRTDMWKSDIPENSIQTIEIGDNIRLKHAFIILTKLEEEQKERMLIEERKSLRYNDVEQNNDTNTTEMNSPASQSSNTSQSRRDAQKKRNLRN